MRWTAYSCPVFAALVPVQGGRPSSFPRGKKRLRGGMDHLVAQGARGEHKDEAGPLIGPLLGDALPLALCRGFMLPDEGPLLRALHKRYDRVCTTGGTGLSPRDRTPEATEKVLDYLVPGMAQAMMAMNLAPTPRAVLSRAVTGEAGRCLILNLPGSP